MQPRITILSHTLRSGLRSPSIPFDTEESPDHPLYFGNPWFLRVVGSYYRPRDRLDRLLS